LVLAIIVVAFADFILYGCRMVISAKLCVAGMAVLSAWWWPFETVYVWTRDDGDVFRLQYTMTADHKITVLENSTPSARSTAVLPQRGLNIRDYYRPCQFFDIKNFVCRSLAAQDYIEMHDGKLIHYYWGEVRSYRTDIQYAH
jgi:hypothetical protein